MKSFTLIVSVLLLNISSYSCTDSMMIVNHPDVEFVYKMGSKPSAVTLNTFVYENPDMVGQTKEIRYNLCKRSIEAPQFIVPEQKEKLPAPRERGLFTSIKAREAIENFYRYRAISKALIASLVRIALKNNSIDIKYAIPCLTEDWSWALAADGLHADHFFGLLQLDNEDNFHVHGLVERIPDLQQNTRNNSEQEMKQLELSFYKSSRKMKFFKENLCTLTRLEKVRLCSAIYLVWREKLNKLPLYQVNFMRDHNMCVSSTKIHFRYLVGDTRELESIKVDILPCAINEELSNPTFFLTADQKEVGGIIVLEQMESVTEHVEKKYALVMRVKYKQSKQLFKYWDIHSSSQSSHH